MIYSVYHIVYRSRTQTLEMTELLPIDNNTIETVLLCSKPASCSQLVAVSSKTMLPQNPLAHIILIIF